MISFKRQAGLCAVLALTAGTWLAFSKADDATPPGGMMPADDFPKDYKGTPFTDSRYKDGAKDSRQGHVRLLRSRRRRGCVSRH